MKGLVDSLESSMFTLNILLDEVDRELGQEKKTCWTLFISITDYLH